MTNTSFLSVRYVWTRHPQLKPHLQLRYEEHTSFTNETLQFTLQPQCRDLIYNSGMKNTPLLQLRYEKHTSFTNEKYFLDITTLIETSFTTMARMRHLIYK